MNNTFTTVNMIMEFLAVTISFIKVLSNVVLVKILRLGIHFYQIDFQNMPQ